MMSGAAFYDLEQIDRIAVNLFYGWGYNFYRVENQVRHDDLTVREKVSWLLGQCRSVVDEQERAYRRRSLPLPTREKPLPDPVAVEAAKALEGLSAAIGRLEGTIRSLPAPETDRMTQRYRDELEMLVKLREHDCHLVGRAQMLVDMVAGKDHAWMLENMVQLRQGLALMAEDVQARQAALMA